jgi:hypothetical protein
MGGGNLDLYMIKEEFKVFRKRIYTLNRFIQGNGVDRMESLRLSS